MVLLGLASSPSQHSHLSGVQFLDIFFSNVQHSYPFAILGLRPYYDCVDLIFDLDRHLLVGETGVGWDRFWLGQCPSVLNESPYCVSNIMFSEST